MRAWMMLLLLVPAGLAGCLGGQDGNAAGPRDPAGGELADDAGSGPGDDQALIAHLRFAGGEDVAEVRWENGTFEVTEHSWPKGMVTGQVGEYDPDRREIDISPLVPQGVPAVLVAEVSAELGQGDVDLWFDLPQEEIWVADFDTPYGGYSRVEMVVVHSSSEPVTLNLRYDEIDDSASFDYTLQYAVYSHPTILQPGVPVAVEAPEAASGIAIDFMGEAEERAVMLWGPDDTFLGRLEPSGDRLVRVLEPEDPRGAYVVMLPEGAGHAHLSLLGVEEAPSDLRVLSQDIRFGTPQQAGQGETEIAWSFQVDTVPLQAGVFWSSGEVSHNTEARLTSPAGDVLDLEITSDPWIGGAGFGVITDMGEQRLVAGTYEARVSFDQNAGPTPMEAMHVVVFYDRGR